MADNWYGEKPKNWGMIVTPDEYWAQDKLGRRDDADFLTKFLLSRVNERAEMDKPRSYVLNIDAKWGDGKTFFLRGLEVQLSEVGYPVAYVNAWTDDHAEDPMIAVVSAIDRTIAPLLSSNEKLKTDWGKVRKSASKIARSIGKGIVIQASKKIIGDGVEELASAVAGDAIDAFFEERDEIKAFRDTLSSILKTIKSKKSQKTPLFVLIDELDRCRPPYAISMLERVKHLFEIDDVVFVIATDSEQLQHAIRSVYGSDFASERYLSRFFDRSFRFAEPSHAEFVAKLFAEYPLPLEKLSSPPDDDHEHFFCCVADEFSLGLRDIEQAFDLFRSVVTTWEYRAHVELVVLLPLIALWQKKVEYMSLAFSHPAFSERLKGDFLSAPKCLLFESHDGGGRYTAEKKAIWEVLLRIVNWCKKDIPDSMQRYGDASVVDNWIHSIMSHELAAIHNGKYTPDAPPYSVLRDYPKIIQNLQRIAPSAED